MWKIFFAFLALYALPLLGLSMPNPDLWDDFAEEYLVEMTSEEGGDIGLYEELLEKHRNPLNINKATREDLLKMPFLSEAQVDSVLSLVQRSHGLLTMGELQFVKNLEYKERQYLTLFFFCPKDLTYYNRQWQGSNDSLSTKASQTSNPKIHTSVDGKRLASTLSTTLGVPLYKREGFRYHSPEELQRYPNREYLGDNLSTTLRYRSSLNNRLLWGLTAQKDEGEPFASHGNSLYDSYSLFLMGKSSKVVQKWIVGDFMAHFGLGLTIGSSSVDAMNILSSLRPKQEDFTAHTSTEEALFLRGAAIALKFNTLSVRAFGSWRQQDATLYKDSISTIITDGYHRTPLEMSKRNNISTLQGGLSATLDLQPFSLGLNVVHTHYNTPFRTPVALYRRYYFQGKDFGNYSITYSWRKGPLAMWGETATSLQGGIASQHRLQYGPGHNFIFDMLHRYYSTHYLSTSGMSYKIGSRLQNEHGIMAGFTWKPTDLWHLKAYADWAHFPFAVYASKNPKDALTALIQAEFTPYQTTTWLFRYKLRQRPDDNKAGEADLQTQHTLKAQFRYANSILSLTSTADLTLLSQPDKDNSSGWMISQKASANVARTTRINVSAAFFHTDSYSEALRLYEPILLYSSGYPSCYYHGQRFSASVQHLIGPLSIAFKYSLTHYTNRDSIGSDQRKYNGSTLQDLLFQLALHF